MHREHKDNSKGIEMKHFCWDSEYLFILTLRIPQARIMTTQTSTY